MSLETFLTILYVWVDNWYKQHIGPYRVEKRGCKPSLSDSEVLTLAIMSQWRVGVPWQSERGFVRYMQAYGKGMFPHMLERSAFNLRVRYLWGALVKLQQVVAQELETPDVVYECVDCYPLPAFTSGQASKDKAHWLWESTVGRGGNRGGFFWGDHLLLAAHQRGAVTGWVVASASIQDRWLMEAVLSARAGQPQLRGPAHRPRTARAQRALPPVGHIGPRQAAGVPKPRPYLADKGFNGQRWLDHWSCAYAAHVIAVPPDNSHQPWPPPLKTWLASKRQLIETVFSVLHRVFGLDRLNAHSRWGQYTRIAAKLAAFNIALFINQLLNRPLWAVETLIC
jgi:hypothetical protein